MRILLLTISMLALTVFSGCTQSADGSYSLFTTRRPVDAARDAFNIYDADIRRRAVYDLSNAPFGGEEQYLKVYRLLAFDVDATVRAPAIRALAKHGQLEDVRQVFIPNLTYVDTIVRYESARALQRFHDSAAVTPLLKVAREDDQTDVRIAAIYALRQYPSSVVYQSLVGLLNDDDYTVVKHAHQALINLTGKKFADDSNVWLKWAESNENIFAGKTPYFYHEYVSPPTVSEKLAFWEEQEKPSPKRPLGLDTDHRNDKPE